MVCSREETHRGVARAVGEEAAAPLALPLAADFGGHTTRSNVPPSSGGPSRPSSLRRQSVIAGSVSGGTTSGSRERTIASQRPSKPVRSCREMVASRPISTIPPSCQCQSAPSVPNVAASRRAERVTPAGSVQRPWTPCPAIPVAPNRR